MGTIGFEVTTIDIVKETYSDSFALTLQLESGRGRGLEYFLLVCDFRDYQ